MSPLLFRSYEANISSTHVLGISNDVHEISNDVHGISKDLVLSKLPVARDASFDSYADEHDARCHPKTRVALLQEVKKWARDPDGPCIFWLNGMAGTGKSTISRTLAESFAKEGDLGASFFFKRGERDRSTAARLFTTIARQLVAKEPALATRVRSAIEANPDIAGKTLKDQFRELILEPLRQLKEDPYKSKRIVLIIDTLDECERDDDIRIIIYLLSQAKTLSHIQLRSFVTSRPELPIRLGFNDIKGIYQDLILHEIPKPIIEHDIAAYLFDRLTRIKDDYNSLYSEQQLPLDWPGLKINRVLIEMAIPLFIFAATICRFIEDRAWSDPVGQLEKILEYQWKTQHSEIDKLDATYRPVLDQLLRGNQKAQQSLIDEFRTVVGSIILLTEPLSTVSLTALLNIPKAVIDRRLVSLHSVLSVPASLEAPIRMFHLSFRDFLIDPEKRDSNPFWIDESATHERIASRCLELLSSNDHLKKDICDLGSPGISRTKVDPALIEARLPTEVRYACLYWAHHLERSYVRITDDHQIHGFLKSHFLYWLEALSLLGKISESLAMIKGLQTLLSVRPVRTLPWISLICPTSQLIVPLSPAFFVMQTDLFLIVDLQSISIRFNSILQPLFSLRKEVRSENYLRVIFQTGSHGCQILQQIGMPAYRRSRAIVDRSIL
jgi:hypothetical protein